MQAKLVPNMDYDVDLNVIFFSLARRWMRNFAAIPGLKDQRKSL
jgi:hypothetical protein